VRTSAGASRTLRKALRVLKMLKMNDRSCEKEAALTLLGPIMLELLEEPRRKAGP
jgi:hypothetical protein